MKRRKNGQRDVSHIHAEDVFHTWLTTELTQKQIAESLGVPRHVISKRLNSLPQFRQHPDRRKGRGPRKAKPRPPKPGHFYKITKAEVAAAVEEHPWAANRDLAVILSKPIPASAFTDAGIEDTTALFELLTAREWVDYDRENNTVRLICYLRHISDALTAALGGKAPPILAVLKTSQVTSGAVKPYTRAIPAYHSKPRNRPDPAVRDSARELFDYRQQTGAGHADIASHFNLPVTTVTHRLHLHRSTSGRLPRTALRRAVARNPEATMKDLAVMLSQPVSRDRLIATAGPELFTTLKTSGWIEAASFDTVRLTAYLKDIARSPDLTPVLPLLRQSQVSEGTVRTAIAKYVPHYQKKNGGTPVSPVGTTEILRYWKQTRATQAQMAQHFGLAESTIWRKLRNVAAYKPDRGAPVRPPAGFFLQAEIRIAALSQRADFLHKHGPAVLNIISSLLSPHNDLFDDLLNEAFLCLLTSVSDNTPAGIDRFINTHLATYLRDRLKEHARPPRHFSLSDHPPDCDAPLEHFLTDPSPLPDEILLGSFEEF